MWHYKSCIKQYIHSSKKKKQLYEKTTINLASRDLCVYVSYTRNYKNMPPQTFGRSHELIVIFDKLVLVLNLLFCVVQQLHLDATDILFISHSNYRFFL